MRIGILGGGQLGRMLALAGYPLDLTFRFLDPAADAPAGQVGVLHVGAYEDPAVLAAFAAGLDLITYEFENVPVTTVEQLAARVPVFPPARALAVAQDRLHEKRCFQSLGIPTPAFQPVDTYDDLLDAVARIGLPAVLKTRRFGYDGKGQFVIRTSADVPTAWQTLGGVPLILEAFVPFEREVSVLAVRGWRGEIAFYPLVENHHRDGILRLSLAPAPGLTPALQTRAEAYARKVLESLDYVGVLAIELFQVAGELLANEMAPRVHNSGHWTIEGAETSQFENHLRAGLGLPLGATTPRGVSAMVNLIGIRPDFAEVLRMPDAHLHWYGKAPRPGRKVGHVTLRAERREDLLAKLAVLQQSIDRQIPIESNA